MTQFESLQINRNKKGIMVENQMHIFKRIDDLMIDEVNQLSIEVLYT